DTVSGEGAPARRHDARLRSISDAGCDHRRTAAQRWHDWLLGQAAAWRNRPGPDRLRCDFPNPRGRAILRLDFRGGRDEWPRRAAAIDRVPEAEDVPVLCVALSSQY